MQNLDYHDLNAMLNLLDKDGKIQFDSDKEAAKQFFLQHVNQNTVFFHSLEEKLDYLFKHDFYEKEVYDRYSSKFVKWLYKRAYAKKFRFETFLGAYKYYTSYTLKTLDGQRYLERYEDRVCAVALTLAGGNEDLATAILDEIVSGRYQPATPTFLNAGKKRRGEFVSCFLLRVEDNMESIGRTINSALQLSKRGGGVGILLTNLREQGAPIKGIMNMSSGVVPVMKVLEDSFSYANQLGARQGAGVVYLNAHHPDIMRFLDTKRENADEKIRIKTLSVGVVVPDITFELARKNEPMYLFSPYDVERVYGKAFADVSVTKHYYEMVNDERIRKTKINPRDLFQTIAELQFESGYPYLLFEDNATRQNPGKSLINMTNLCVEILQENEASDYNEDLTYAHVGTDISCNLGSMNIAKTMDGKDLAKTVATSVRALTYVADNTSINSVPSLRRGNAETRAIGLGQMNLHGYLAREGVFYGSPESIEFTSVYFAAVAYYSILESMNMARMSQSPFVGFEKTAYADGSFFDKYVTKDWLPESPKVKALFKNIDLPTRNEWMQLKELVQQHGMYHKYLRAVPPTGSISYINNSTSSIHPIVAKIEVRKEGKIGRVYYPAAFMTNDNLQYYQDAYEIGPEKLIDVYAAANEHTDQGLSMTLFFKDDATTRDINKAQIYAYKKGLKTVYYIRIKQQALEGTDVQGCVSCTL